MEYAIGIDLGGTSIKYALVDKAGNSFFEGKLPSFASVSAAKVIEQLIKAVMLLKDEAAKQNWTVLGIGLNLIDDTSQHQFAFTHCITRIKVSHVIIPIRLSSWNLTPYL